MNGSIKIPCEWSKQEEVWLAWPVQEKWWPNLRRECEEAFSKLVSAISEFERVRIICPENKIESVKSSVGPRSGVEYFKCETNDVWCRDSGAIFGFSEGGLAALDFRYNSWGGKFPPWDKDDALAEKMALETKARRIRVDGFVCEGGALEFGENGTLITTESVVLNPNRNPGATRESVERLMEKICGVSKICWLKGGLANDDTDGHVDNIARFAPGGKILACVCPQGNPSKRNLDENLETLKNFSDARGKKFDVVPLPLPEPAVCFPDGSTAPASYANYLAINGAVIVPQYGGRKTDFEAREIIKSAFPGREIVGLECGIFLREGGAVHCLTQQQPSL